ncbi:MAG TPA: tetratricopeptide repeat protein, partial [Nitrospirota bacterium]|nr:tetratricopeptide repeat protein [Nitrospirota bacterium]
AEDPAIGEGLIEADVLIKYGLTAKALEQLEALATKFPDVLRIRVRMRDLYRESGNAKQAAAHSLKAADICSQEGRADQAESLLREALEIDPRNAEVLSRLGMEAPAPEEAPPAAGDLGGELPPFEVPIVLPVPPSSPPGEEAAPSAPEPVIPLPEPEPPAPPEEIIEQEAPAAPPRKAARKPKPPEPEPAEEAEAVEARAPEEGQAKELAAEPMAGEVDISEVWAEAEFYYQQGLYDEARKKYEQILEQQPDDKRTLKRIKEISRQKDEVQEFTNLAEAVESLESLVPGGELATSELATSTSDEEAVRSLMQDIQSMKQQEAAREQEKERQRQEREQRERESRELAEKEAQLRAEQEARERAEKELQELRQQRDREREARAQAERDAQLRAEQEARERAEKELRELRQQRDRERESRAEREARERAEKEFREQEAFFQAESEAGWSTPEEDFSELGDELRSKPELFVEPAPAPKAVPGSITAPPEDFFDLAAELKEELGSIASPEQAAGQTEEQSLDDIFEDFKRGVEQQESKQDVNTHYNLGIAYKEMGLLDDAIAEFMLTTEGEQRFVESKYMLGLCYLEQGEYYKAIAEIHNALNYAISFGVSDEERITMFYDLGLAYQGVGNTEEAINQFQMVMQLNPQYRDAAVKLHELRAGDLVSLEQLKDDIEKEISSKFLEEGERIEREEKTRKDDKVRQ